MNPIYGERYRARCGLHGKGGEPFRNKLGGDREASKRMVAQYEDKADQIARQGGRQAFEWPRWCTGWKETQRWQHIADRDLWVVDFDGCMLGMKNEKGQPVKKMWRVATDDPELAITLGMFVCRHPPGTHAKIAGQTTKTTAFYPQPMCDIIARVWYGGSSEEVGDSAAGEGERARSESETDEGSLCTVNEQDNESRKAETGEATDKVACPVEARNVDPIMLEGQGCMGKRTPAPRETARHVEGTKGHENRRDGGRCIPSARSVHSRRDLWNH